MILHLNANLKSLPPIVREFIKALGQKHTYSLRKNWYCFFGILWGIPVPVVTMAVDLYSSGLNPTINNILRVSYSHPFHLFFLLHPLIFGVVFGAMGTVRFNKEQKIRQLDKLKSTFLSMVSHELRSPLTTMLGYITYLKTEKAGPLNQTQKDCLKISEEEAIILNHLIEELLNLSKIEAGEFKVNLQSVDMNELISKAVISLRLQAENQGITLENNLPQGLPQVLADQEKILQVATNLIENAIKFNKQGGKISISAVNNAKDKKIIFSVADTGIGIPENKLDKIFDKFYQVDSFQKRRYSGCGLGLAISKSILNLHQGRIWAESTVGSGSKFLFELLIS
jgi:signal transduction histidine kinase